MNLTHTDDQGRASMVDVSGKPAQNREAIAEGFIHLQHSTLELIQQNGLKKGDVLAVARIAGNQRAKQPDLHFLLCRQLPGTKLAVVFAVQEGEVRITAVTKTVAQTGVEMEALTAVSLAALTIYDMCKAVDKTMTISEVRLVSKTKN